MENDNTLRRLKTVEGHLRGIIRMVEDDAYCIDCGERLKPVDLPCPACTHLTSAHEWDYALSWTVCDQCRQWGGECEP